MAPICGDLYRFRNAIRFTLSVAERSDSGYSSLDSDRHLLQSALRSIPMPYTFGPSVCICGCYSYSLCPARSREERAARLLDVGAVREPALPQVRPELAEAPLDLLRRHVPQTKLAQAG